MLSMYSGNGDVQQNLTIRSSVLKYALLALVAQRPRHGYDLKAAFERAMGGTWPLNIGQIYTTLARLERDGLVESEIVEQDARPDRKVYQVTERGTKELDRWLAEPVEFAPPLRDELYIKFLAQRVAGADPSELLGNARRTLHAALAATERQQSAPKDNDNDVDPVATVLLDAVSLQLDAALRWLDRADS